MKTKLLFICSGLIMSVSSFILGKYIGKNKIKKHGTLDIIHYNNKAPEMLLILDKQNIEEIDNMSKEKYVSFSVANIYKDTPNNHDA